MLTQSDKDYLEEHFVTIELFNETMGLIATKKEFEEFKTETKNEFK